MSAYLHRHGKERREMTGDGGTQITCRPSFSQAHHRRARSPAAKLYIRTYTYTPNICIYIFPTKRPSSWSAREGNMMMTLMLFVFVRVLSVSVSICVAIRVDTCTAYVCAHACVPPGYNNACSASLRIGPRAWSCATSPLSGYQVQHLPYALYKHLCLPSKTQLGSPPFKSPLSQAAQSQTSHFGCHI